jgi:hypothetical protein
MTDSPAPPARIRRLIGVYNADGTVRGELAYWIGARLGRAHCALCDITHGSVRERSDWKQCRTSLAVPFDTYHRDDQPDQVRNAAGDQAPAVVADTDRGHVLLLEPDDIDGCNGSPQRLADALAGAAERHRLQWH